MSAEKEYWKPSVTADVVLLERRLELFDDYDNYVLLVKRSEKSPAFPGCWALPGGFLEEGESLEECALRELKEETGVVAKHLRLIGMYSDPNRDPRGRVISAAYFSAIDSTKEMPLSAIGGDDAADCAMFKIRTICKYPGNELSDIELVNGDSQVMISFSIISMEDQYGRMRYIPRFKTETRLAFDHGEILARALVLSYEKSIPYSTDTNIM